MSKGAEMGERLVSEEAGHMQHLLVKFYTGTVHGDSKHLQ